jgi:hypothetical protein
MPQVSYTTTLTRRTTMLRIPWSAAGAAILALAVSHPAAAQAPTPNPAAAAAPTTSLAPTLAATHLSFSAEDDAPLTVNTSAARMGPTEGKAAMIVGGAVVVIGAVVGGDGGTLLVISGVGLSLFGLYVWQRGD